MLSDTDPEAAEAEWERIRRMTPAEKTQELCALVTAAFTESKRAIAEANPGASQREIDHIFISVHYGEQLANEVKEYLEKRDREQHRPANTTDLDHGSHG